MNTLLLSTSLCLEWSLDLKTVIGKIVLCDRGINSRAVKCEVVKKASGVEMILANGVFDGEGLVADCHIFPAIAVGASVGDEIRKYIITAEKSKSSAIATIVFKSPPLVAKHKFDQLISNKIIESGIKPPGGVLVHLLKIQDG
ncbi:hypothetical protein LWI28_017536 [Acer negundo]|uniref:PA domain-containing protein n=1 Tax=Acer negundo TaxID=4023 RepID=A0AAD5NJX8_ACENE|nr:hypothetical protein LWI28_017536 [Acer negundo]